MPLIRSQHDRGAMLVEMITALAILCGAALVILTALSKTAGLPAASAARVAAAQRLSETLDGLRAGAIPVKLGGEAVVAPPEGETKSALSCVVRAEAWKENPELAKLVVTVSWKSPDGRAQTLSAETLVRQSRLKAAGGAP